METNWKQWEKPLLDLEDTIKKFKELALKAKPEKKEELDEKIRSFEEKRDEYITKIYGNLSAWEKVLVARAETRPYTLDYIQTIFTHFTELDGDRRFSADQAIVGGPAFFEGKPVMVIGHQKGRNIQERQKRNFAMARPEGYRKAIRLMDMANRFGLPVICFIDTPAADPSVGGESRGISEAIAASMLKMFELEVPVICTVIGEGGSGGGLGIGVGNIVYMLEHSIYSVIPPEGCAAILWRAPEKAPEAAEALQLTAQSAKKLKLIDEILPEPFGGAHRNSLEVANTIKAAISKGLSKLSKHSANKLKEDRHKKFIKMGNFTEIKEAIIESEPVN